MTKAEREYQEWRLGKPSRGVNEGAAYLAGYKKRGERDAEIVMMDSCGNPTCDTPRHYGARMRAEQIRKLDE